MTGLAICGGFCRKIFLERISDPAASWWRSLVKLFSAGMVQTFRQDQIHIQARGSRTVFGRQTVRVEISTGFVHLDHLAGVATDAAVGEEIGRVGKDGVEPSGVAVFGVDGVEEFEAVAVVEPQGAVGVGEG